jgi:monoamine oxidase
MGAGIAGLSCAYELVRRGHQVTVIEASGRTGGHVRTFHDPFADGLYADVGAEHFYYPGYNHYWRYLKEFSLTAVPYPRRDNMVRYLKGERYEEEDLHRPAVLGKLGFNQKEVDFLATRPWAELSLLYLQRYVDFGARENFSTSALEKCPPELDLSVRRGNGRSDDESRCPLPGRDPVPSAAAGSVPIRVSECVNGRAVSRSARGRAGKRRKLNGARRTRTTAPAIVSSGAARSNGSRSRCVCPRR